MKKLTKAEIYAKHGITYDQKTGKILAPNMMWINPVLVNGNEKIGKGAFHFSTLPGNIEYHLNISLKKEVVISKKTGKPVTVTVIDEENPIFIDITGTCPITCKGCYAMTGNYNYKTTLAYLAIRTIIARFYMNFLERAIIAQIEADNIKLLRIHASGDFFSVEYAEMWKRIAIAFPGTLFWTYTKCKDCEHIFDGIENANVIPSILQFKEYSIKGFNFGHCDYIIKAYKILTALGYKVHVCFCGIEEYANLKTVHCTDCKCCAECDYVLFIEHSTEYVASKDPLFKELVELILNQPIKSAKLENAA